MKEIKVKLTFTEPVLGTCPGDPNIYRTFVASNSPDAATMEDEVAAIGVDGVVEKGKTVFPKLDDGTPFFYDYQIKGFFKDTCGGLRKVKETKSSSIKAFKKEIDKLIFVEPRTIPILFDGEMGECCRPLRAQTMQITANYEPYLGKFGTVRADPRRCNVRVYHHSSERRP